MMTDNTYFDSAWSLLGRAVDSLERSSKGAFGKADSAQNLNGYEIVVDLGAHPTEKGKTLVYGGKTVLFGVKGEILVLNETDAKKVPPHVTKLGLDVLSLQNEARYKVRAALDIKDVIDRLYTQDYRMAGNLESREDSAFGKLMRETSYGPTGEKRNIKDIPLAQLQAAIDDLSKNYPSGIPAAIMPPETTRTLAIASRLADYRESLASEVRFSSLLSRQQRGEIEARLNDSAQHVTPKALDRLVSEAKIGNMALNKT